MDHDIYARISLKKTEDGGRTATIPAIRDYRCTIFFQNEPGFEEHGYDCRLLLTQIGRDIAPGETLERVPAKFLCPETVLPHLRIGTSFQLWEGKIIGYGEVLSIEVPP